MAAAGLHPSRGLRVQGWMFRVSGVGLGVGLGASGCRGSEFRPTVWLPKPYSGIHVQISRLVF